MTTDTNAFEKTNSRNVKIKARFIRPVDRTQKSPLVIMLTGDGPRGSNSLSWSNLPPRLAEDGIASLLFDFSGLGNSEGERKELTLSQGIEDFRLIFDQLHNFDWIDFDRLGLMSSSFGASVLLTCPDIANKAKVLGFKSPCPFLPDAYLNEIGNEKLSDWVKTGFCEENGYNISAYFDSFLHNIYEKAGGIETKCLITHGTQDEIVPFTQSIHLKEVLKGETELIEFKGGDHGYSGENWEKMAQIFVAFFKKNL